MFTSELRNKEERIVIMSPYLLTFNEPRNRFRGIDFSSLWTGPPGWELIPGLLKRVTYVLDLENDGHFWKNLLKMEKVNL